MPDAVEVLLLVLGLAYLVGCGVVVILFALMLTLLYRQKSEDGRYLFGWFRRMMPKHVVLWPWFCAISPIRNWRQIREYVRQGYGVEL